MRRWMIMLALATPLTVVHAQEPDAATPAQPAPANTAPAADAPQAVDPAPVTPAPAPAAEPPATGPDLSVLRADLASVMDELIAARARVSVIAKALFNTPLSIRVVRRADEQRLDHITLRLDGVPVHDSDGASLARGEADLFEGFAAPGVHEVAIEISEVSTLNADYRYVRSERFRFEIKKGMRTRVELIVRDKSDMAEELPEDDDGEYDVSTVLRVEAESVKD